MSVTDQVGSKREQEDWAVERYDRLEGRIEATLREQGVEREKIIEILAKHYILPRCKSILTQRLRLDAIKLVMKIDPSYTVATKKIILRADVKLRPQELREYQQRRGGGHSPRGVDV